MKTMLPLMLLTLAGIAAGAHATEPVARTPLAAADCIKTDQINEWYIVNARSAIVRTGPKRYLVTLQNDCPNLNHPPGLVFRASPSQSAVSAGTICGSTGETVRSSSQPDCAISSVAIIDKPRFQQLVNEAKAYQKGAKHPAD